MGIVGPIAHQPAGFDKSASRIARRNRAACRQDVLSLLGALLTVGSLSDYIGRRPAILAALSLNIVAMIMFMSADSALALIAARAVQRFATGLATATLGSAIMDTDRSRGPVDDRVVRQHVERHLDLALDVDAELRPRARSKCPLGGQPGDGFARRLDGFEQDNQIAVGISLGTPSSDMYLSKNSCIALLLLGWATINARTSDSPGHHLRKCSTT